MHTATSARKAEANRANAQKSTGPTSDAGKTRSSENAKRHGILTGAARLLAEPTQELQDLLTTYASDLQPVGAHQEMLVREVAVADYRIQHLDRVERGLVAVQTNSAYNVVLQAEQLAEFAARPPACGNCGATQPHNPNVATSDAPELADAGEDIQTLMLGAAWSQNPAAFSLLARYQAQARRDYYRALKQLGEVRTGKASYLPENSADQTKPPEPPPPPAEKQTTPQSKPTETDYPIKWEDTNPLFVPNQEESRQIFGIRKNDYQFPKGRVTL